MMEPCCWGTYTQHRDAHKNLSMFDDIHMNAHGGGADEFDDEEECFDDNDDDLALTSAVNRKRGQRKNSKRTVWKRIQAFRPVLWSILEKPFSSVYAQVMLNFYL